MTIVTEKETSEELEQQISLCNWRVFDVVLDDSTWLPDTMVINDQAFGLHIGGHSAFQFFRDIPELANRKITHFLPLRRYHSLPFGWWLRERWARKAGANLKYPAWRLRM